MHLHLSKAEKDETFYGFTPSAGQRGVHIKLIIMLNYYAAVVGEVFAGGYYMVAFDIIFYLKK